MRGKWSPSEYYIIDVKDVKPHNIVGVERGVIFFQNIMLSVFSRRFRFYDSFVKKMWSKCGEISPHFFWKANGNWKLNNLTTNNRKFIMFGMFSPYFIICYLNHNSDKILIKQCFIHDICKMWSKFLACKKFMRLWKSYLW